MRPIFVSAVSQLADRGPTVGSAAEQFWKTGQYCLEIEQMHMRGRPASELRDENIRGAEAILIQFAGRLRLAVKRPGDTRGCRS